MFTEIPLCESLLMLINLLNSLDYKKNLINKRLPDLIFMIFVNYLKVLHHPHPKV